MRVRRIELRQFKRFDSLNIDLGLKPQKLIALVGPNGSGKSSVFDAFEEKQKYYKGANFTPQPFYFSKQWFAAEGALQAYDRNAAIQIFKAGDDQTFDKRSFYIRTSYRFTSRLNVTEVRRQPDMLDDSSRPGSSTEIDSRLTENYERMIGIAWDEFWSEEDDGKTGKATRMELLERVNSVLENVLEIRISNLGNIAQGKGQLFFQKGSTKDFPYEVLSAGEKEVIDIVLDLIIKTSEYHDTIYCIDEPELHISTKIQRKLLVEIEKLVPETCQLWIATHSIGFLRALQEDLKDKTSVLDFSGHNFDGEVNIVPIKPSRENWKRIFETALEDLTGLLAPKRIIYCEGRTEPSATGEELGFDAIVYNKIFSEEFSDTLFISSGGNTELEKNSAIALAILNKAFSEVEIMLLKDRDINRDGTPTTDEQRQEWLNVDSGNRRMLSRKEIENYICDFEIVHKKYPSVTEEKYMTVIPDVVNGEVKDRCGELMRICGVLTGKNQDEFKLELTEMITPDTSVYSKLKQDIF